MIEAVIFDLDGVVTDTEPLWDKQMDIFLGRRGISDDRKTTKPLLTGKTLEEGVLILQKLYGFTGDVKAQAAERSQIIAELFEKEVGFVPGFEEFFAAASSYKKAVATALRRSLVDIIDKKLGLSALFGDYIYSISDIGNISKPDPAIFLHAAKMLRVPPEKCLVIEDSPNGVEAARRAGMKCIGLATTFPDLKGADVIVSSYAGIDIQKMFP